MRYREYPGRTGRWRHLVAHHISLPWRKWQKNQHQKFVERTTTFQLISAGTLLGFTRSVTTRKLNTGLLGEFCNLRRNISEFITRDVEFHERLDEAE